MGTERAELLAKRHPRLAEEIRDMIAAKGMLGGDDFFDGPAGTESRSFDDFADEHPSRFGDFRVIRVLAVGGMAVVVYRAEQESLDNRKVVGCRQDDQSRGQRLPAVAGYSAVRTRAQTPA